MDKNHERSGFGDVVWKSEGTQHTGSFDVSDDPSLGLPVEYLIKVNELRADEPSLVVKLNGAHAARIDINGRHKFTGERGARQSTHFQCNDRGWDADLTTTEIPTPPFPALTRGVNVSYEAELQRCFRASVAWLNVDVTGVGWTPMPFEGGK